jgi:hypothetical protein
MLHSTEMLKLIKAAVMFNSEVARGLVKHSFPKHIVIGHPIDASTRLKDIVITDIGPAWMNVEGTTATGIKLPLIVWFTGEIQLDATSDWKDIPADIYAYVPDYSLRLVGSQGEIELLAHKLFELI